MALTADQKVGAFSLVAIVILGVVTFQVGKMGDMLKQWERLRVHFTSAAGLQTGSPVYLAGLKVGKVEAISVDRGKIWVSLKIERRYVDDILEDSSFGLQRDSLLGQWHVAVSLGSKGKPALDITKPIEGRDAPDLILDAHRFLEDISRGEGAFGQLNAFFKEAGDAASSLSRVLNENASDVRKVVSQINEQLPPALEDFRESMRQARSGEGLVAKMLTDKEFADNLTQAAARIAKIAEAIEQGKGTIGKLVQDPKMYDDLQQTVDAAKRIAAKIDKGEGLLPELLNSKEMAKRFADTVESVRVIAQRMEKGEGLIGQLMVDGELTNRIKNIVVKTEEIAAKMAETVESYKEQVPISAFGSIVFSAF